ncbi:Nif11-like leader peptide family natural product precursor [Synechococcus sp. MIT S9504]|uniref:Nif11-like leader peptide family natural product precursor n=2 Tax=Synechococcus TaxID=1129 RepID=UPI0039C34B8A
MTRKTPMSDEQLQFFLAKAKGDTHLQEKLKTAKSAEEVVCLAKEYGCEFTSEKISQLSKEELEHVAGGCWMNTCWGYGPGTAAAPDWN